MFTGIIEGVGQIRSLKKLSNQMRIAVEAPFSLKKTKLGDSIAMDGCCLTVVSKKNNIFEADISPETLHRTTLGMLKKGVKVNLELPLRMGDRLGGHLVQGHVDGVGKIISNKKITEENDSYHLIKIRVPKTLQIYMIEKGSVAIDGISLTVNETTKTQISLCIIPHTQKKTTLTSKRAGDSVNLEADFLLKYAEKLMPTRKKRKS